MLERSGWGVEWDGVGEERCEGGRGGEGGLDAEADCYTPLVCMGYGSRDYAADVCESGERMGLVVFSLISGNDGLTIRVSGLSARREEGN